MERRDESDDTCVEEGGGWSWMLSIDDWWRADCKRDAEGFSSYDEYWYEWSCIAAVALEG